MKQLLMAIAACTLFACNNKEKDNPAKPGVAAITDEEQYARNVNKGFVADTVKKAVPRLATAVIDSNEITIHYFSPGVRGRMIWGGLVPYEQVWVTGAHSATKISFTKAVKFGSMEIPAGSYAVFTIPGKDSWTFILNNNYRQHLADDYAEREDVLRIKIKPEQTTDTVQRLTYEIKAHGERTASIVVSWEKIKLVIPFVTQKNTASIKQMEPVAGALLQGIKPDTKKDPVCYMPVTAGITDTFSYKKKLYGFCSAECKRLFINDPGHYLADLRE
ncbi:MAG: DUF2911 domain-containing protein [Sphingobacteriales bacterium]|nr:MAG: DUF2911 domain-containing protein [Sphingobacteriales bacterium]